MSQNGNRSVRVNTNRALTAETQSRRGKVKKRLALRLICIARVPRGMLLKAAEFEPRAPLGPPSKWLLLSSKVLCIAKYMPRRIAAGSCCGFVMPLQFFEGGPARL